MAATKKTITRKKPATKASTTKKTTTRKTTPKKAATRAAATKRSRAASAPRTRTTRKQAEPIRSLRLAKQQEPFMSMRVTVQTLYWLILAGAVLLLGLWVLSIHNEVQGIYDDIERSQVLQQELYDKELEMLQQRADRS